jgi:hypothetical protein
MIQRRLTGEHCIFVMAPGLKLYFPLRALHAYLQTDCETYGDDSYIINEGSNDDLQHSVDSIIMEGSGITATSESA